jgi:ribonucleoside-diphosphate reductase alpha chain
MFKTKLAYETWKTKYRFGNETPLQTCERVAKALASVEKNPNEWYLKFLNTLVRFDAQGQPVGLKCTCGGRITANIGTTFKKATLCNCYVSGPVSDAILKYKRQSEDGSISFPVEYKTDSSPDDLINIFLTIAEQAKTLASEGGYGINFDFIRPRGSIIKGTGIKHPGVVSYMNIWDSVSETIVLGAEDGFTNKIKNYLKDEEKFQEFKDTIKTSVRKGAMLGSLSCNHPDCEEFIRAKQQPGVLTKFNISVVLTDEFMKAVETDDFFDQSFGGIVYKRVKARDLYGLIMESCFNRAEPGVLFCDNMQKNNPVAYLGKPMASNPCGEIPGLQSITTVCLLGSLNLTQYVKIKEDRSVCFDYDEYSEDIKIFMRMLDNVNDLTYSPLPSYQSSIEALRQVGMGINGLGSALMMMGIQYNSNEAIEFIKNICQIKENLTWQTSAYLAEEKGVFKAYNKEKFESTEYFLSDRITEETKSLMKKYGVRNAKTTSQPPLGNTSVESDNVSNSIEPAFLLEYERKVICSKWPEGLTLDNVKEKLTYRKGKDFEYWTGPYEGTNYYYEPHNRGLCEINVIRDYGYQWLLDNFPDKDHSKYLITTKDLNVDDHLAVQNTVQYYNNQATSKTCNLPNKYPFEDFKDLYFKAWKMGLNGFTCYRQDSMESVLSAVSSNREEHKIIKKDIKLPSEFLNGSTQIVKREGKKFYLHFSYLPEDINHEFPVCLWIYTNAKYLAGELKICNKASRSLINLASTSGIDKRIIEDVVIKSKDNFPHNRMGRVVSLCLRHNISIEKILSALMEIKEDNASTLLFAVKKFLSRKIPDGTKLNGIKCPACNGYNIVMEAGCQICKDCGSSKCG